MLVKINMLIPLVLSATLILYFLKCKFYKYYDSRSVLLAFLFMFFSLLFSFISNNFILVILQHGFLALSAAFFAIDAYRNKQAG